MISTLLPLPERFQWPQRSRTSLIQLLSRTAISASKAILGHVALASYNGTSEVWLSSETLLSEH